MGRGEYGHSVIGSNGVGMPPARDFGERFGELDAAIQQANRGYQLQHQLQSAQSAQSAQGAQRPAEWIYFDNHWIPFLSAWNAARPELLAGKIDRDAGLMRWVRRYHDLQKIAQALGLHTMAGYLALIRPSIKAGERRLAEAKQLASDVGLTLGMTEEERDRAFDAYYKKKGYPAYLLSTAPKFTT